MAERVAILRRFMKDGKRMRELDCGHIVPDVRGGKPNQANWALCRVCDPKPERVSSGVCGAIVLPQFADSKARPCGQPAHGLKRGEPRCRKHLGQGSA